MNQREQVIDAMLRNGGYSTFNQLNQTVDCSGWKTKTPEATIRRIVQDVQYFFKIRPGLWALNDCRESVLKRLNLEPRSPEAQREFSHSYYQGLLVDLGNSMNYRTFIPNQDKNKRYLEKRLGDVCTLSALESFTFPELMRFAQTVDVVWLNSRRMPNSLFEVEHTTDIAHSLSKFCELQDFYVNFYIVADASRRNLFLDLLDSRTVYQPIAKRTQFCSYDVLADCHCAMTRNAPFFNGRII